MGYDVFLHSPVQHQHSYFGAPFTFGSDVTINGIGILRTKEVFVLANINPGTSHYLDITAPGGTNDPIIGSSPGTGTDSGIRLQTHGTGSFIVQTATGPTALFTVASTGAVTFTGGGALGTGTFSGAATFSGNLILSGGPTITGSVTGYSSELRLGSTSANGTHGLSTQATSSPRMFFDHRATTNTGDWIWRNGTGAGTQIMYLDASGNIQIAGSYVGTGATHSFGSGAVSGSANYTKITTSGTDSYVQVKGVTNGALVLQSIGTGEAQLGGPTTSPVRTKDNAGTPQLGFYGTAPASKPTASGSRGANAALASLLSQLSSLGLITDSTTV